MLADWLIESDLRDGALVDLFPGIEATATDFDTAIWLMYANREQQLPTRVQAVLKMLRAKLAD